MKRIELLTTNCNAYFENKSGGCFAFQRLLRLMYIANASATCPIHFATFSSFLIINISKKMIVCDRVAWSVIANYLLFRVHAQRLLLGMQLVYQLVVFIVLFPIMINASNFHASQNMIFHRESFMNFATNPSFFGQGD